MGCELDMRERERDFDRFYMIMSLIVSLGYFRVLSVVISN